MDKRELSAEDIEACAQFSQALAKSGLSDAEVADRAGVSAGMVHQWKTAKRAVSAKKAEALARAVGGVAPDVISAGYRRIVSAATFNAEPGPKLLPMRMVPIVSMVQGGPDGYFEIIGHVDGESVPFYTRSPHAYALRVKGDSMRPRIRSGQIIVADPDTVYGPEDDVVVKLITGQYMVKELLVERADEIVVTSVNNGERWTIPKANIDYIHCVVDIMRRGF